MSEAVGAAPDQRATIVASLCDAEQKAWDALAGYKFWMFGYHAARWQNYNALLPRGLRFRSPFRALVSHAAKTVEDTQAALPLVEISGQGVLSLPSEGDGA